MDEGIAVNRVGSQGAFFVSASAGAVIPLTGKCSSGNAYPLGENLFPTLWLDMALPNTAEPSGLAFDSAGNLYVADTCSNDVAIYGYVDYVWSYSGNVPGPFSSPFFLTIDDDILAIPSYHGKTAGDPGYVNVIHLNHKTPDMTITKGLQHPVGAAVLAHSPKCTVRTAGDAWATLQSDRECNEKRALQRGDEIIGQPPSRLIEGPLCYRCERFLPTAVSAVIISACSAGGGVTPASSVPAGVAPFSRAHLGNNGASKSGGVEFAYVVNQIDNTISAYAVEAQTGALEPVSGSPFGGRAGQGPNAVTIDPAGKYVM